MAAASQTAAAARPLAPVAAAVAAPPAAPRPPAPPRPVAPKAPPAPAASAAPSSNALPIGPEFFATLDILAGNLDSLDYFQVFRLETTATPREIKDAYYRESRIYHPDRFNQLPDEALKEKINTVFKRITEAYVVLRDDAKRAKYISDISGPERAKKLRYTEASEAEKKAEQRKAIEEQIGTTPKGRECYKLGMQEIDRKRWDAAIRQLKMALMYEPANAKYKEKLKEAEAEYEKTRPKDDFRIK
ncbi:MAG: J domain-containing protein [Myxococcales bacterium]